MATLDRAPIEKENKIKHLPISPMNLATFVPPENPEVVLATSFGLGTVSQTGDDNGIAFRKVVPHSGQMSQVVSSANANASTKTGKSIASRSQILRNSEIVSEPAPVTYLRLATASQAGVHDKITTDLFNNTKDARHRLDQIPQVVSYVNTSKIDTGKFVRDKSLSSCSQIVSDPAQATSIGFATVSQTGEGNRITLDLFNNTEADHHRSDQMSQVVSSANVSTIDTGKFVRGRPICSFYNSC